MRTSEVATYVSFAEASPSKTTPSAKVTIFPQVLLADDEVTTTTSRRELVVSVEGVKASTTNEEKNDAQVATNNDSSMTITSVEAMPTIGRFRGNDDEVILTNNKLITPRYELMSDYLFLDVQVMSHIKLTCN